MKVIKSMLQFFTLPFSFASTGRASALAAATVLLRMNHWNSGSVSIEIPDQMIRTAKFNPTTKSTSANRPHTKKTVSPTSILRPKNDTPHRARNMVKRRGISIVVHPRQHLNRHKTHRHIHNNPKDHKERNKPRRHNRDHALHREPHRAHRDKVEHPQDHEPRVAVLAPKVHLERSRQRCVEERDEKVQPDDRVQAHPDERRRRQLAFQAGEEPRPCTDLDNDEAEDEDVDQADECDCGRAAGRVSVID